jgi:hypothetical protein
MARSASAYADHPDRPVFVGGCPRSGTTLLRTMLNSHPELAIPHETRFVIDAWKQRGRWGDLADADNRRRLARWIVGRRKTRSRRLAKRKPLVRAMVAAPPTLGSVLSVGFELYAERAGKPRWGDKRPSYVLDLDAVFAMWPDAQFVNVVRDPRAVVASICKIGWFEDDLAAGIELWERSQRCAERARRRLAEDQFLELRYETLVAEPRATLERLVAFLGLDPDGLDAMLAYHERADIRSERMHPLVVRPVTSRPLHAWQERLAVEEVALIERALGGRLARYGYEPVADGVPVPLALRRRLLARRAFVRRRRAAAWLREQQLRVTYRRPVAAVRPRPR